MPVVTDTVSHARCGRQPAALLQLIRKEPDPDIALSSPERPTRRAALAN